MENNIENLIFDLDGTIIETIHCITKTINITLKHFNVPYEYNEENVKSFIGYGAKECFRRAFKADKISEEMYEEIFKFYIPLQIKVHFEEAKPFPGLIEMLDELKRNNKKLFVVTNKPHAVAYPLIEKCFGKDYFIDVIGVSDNVIPKPHPSMVDIIVNKYNLDRSKSVYIGDSIIDLQTAQNSSMKSAIVMFGYGLYNELPIEEADYLINDVKDYKIFMKE